LRAAIPIAGKSCRLPVRCIHIYTSTGPTIRTNTRIITTLD